MESFLRERLEAFVEAESQAARQGTAGWLAKKAETLGGSEIAALFGMNPYCSRHQLLERKLGFDEFRGNEACWWGSLFEKLTERHVEYLHDTDLLGADIHISEDKIPGHANSPDGFGVVWFAMAAGALEPVPRHTPGAAPAITLYEFKSPFSREPGDTVPPQYLPQIWSGLALSPASVGLYVDAKYRLCRLGQLGPGPGLCRAYHPREQANTPPIAWGAWVLYAPALGTRAARAAHPDDETDLWAAGAPPADLGALADDSPREFRRVLKWLAAGWLRAETTEPTPGGPDGGAAGLRAEMAALAAAPPAGFVAAGFLPWKLLKLTSVAVAPLKGFAELVEAEAGEFFAEAEQLRDLKDPRAALNAIRAAARTRRGGHRQKETAAQAADALALMNSFGLFDS